MFKQTCHVYDCNECIFVCACMCFFVCVLMCVSARVYVYVYMCASAYMREGECVRVSLLACACVRVLMYACNSRISGGMYIKYSLHTNILASFLRASPTITPSVSHRFTHQKVSFFHSSAFSGPHVPFSPQTKKMQTRKTHIDSPMSVSHRIVSPLKRLPFLFPRIFRTPRAIVPSHQTDANPKDSQRIS